MDEVVRRHPIHISATQISTEAQATASDAPSTRSRGEIETRSDLRLEASNADASMAASEPECNWLRLHGCSIDCCRRLGRLARVAVIVGTRRARLDELDSATRVWHLVNEACELVTESRSAVG